jgi:hypothetical protein
MPDTRHLETRDQPSALAPIVVVVRGPEGPRYNTSSHRDIAT